MKSEKCMLVSLCFIIAIIAIIASPFAVSAAEEYRFEKAWPSVQQPWYFSYPTDVAADASGNIYVLEGDTDRIRKLSPDGTFMKMWGGEGSGDGQFNGPYGLAIDSAGNIYIADRWNHRIQKFSSDGVFITKWGKYGTGDGEFYNPRRIAIDAAGNLYVTDSSNHRIQKFTSNGTFLAKWGSEGSEDGQFNEPYGIATDSSGNIYVADSKNHRIQKFTANGAFLVKWGSSGTGESMFNTPAGIAINADGDIYVTDSWNHRIQKFSPDGTFIEKFGSCCFGSWGFRIPQGIAIDKNGNIYVADCDNDRIKIYDSTHQFLNGWGSTSSDDGAFHTPHGIAADGSGNIYVVDMYNNRIQKFNADGAFQMKFGRAGYGDGDMYYPVAIAPDSSGNIYVTDGYTDRVQKYGPDGTFILNWGSEGTGDGQFDGLRGIAVDGNGNVYVSDLRNHRIQKFTSQGVFLRQWGSSGTGDGQFYYPRGLAADTAGNIYVADTSNDRIQKFTSEGVFLAKWGSYGTGDGQLKNPEGISVDAQGYVYVTDTDNHRIQKFTSSGQFVARIGAYGSDAGSLNEPTYSCIGPNGKIYVSDTNNHRVQVFRKANLIERKTKAIIVAGGGPFPQNTLWNATQLCASFAYRALTYQGYDSESIYYLSADTRLDIDGNGTPDVDANATNANLQTAITSWAYDADDLFIYMTDHGGDGTFRMGPAELLYATELDTWLDSIQNTIPGKLVLVYDACRSGSFLPLLTPPAGKTRILVSSAGKDEESMFFLQGKISFSFMFWASIFNGDSFYNSYISASENIGKTYRNPHTPRQVPLLDANANGIGNEKEDKTLAQAVVLGNGIVSGADIPFIGSVSPAQTLNGPTSAKIYAENVVDADGISRVWAVITPPDYTVSPDDPVTDMPMIELKSVGGNRYEGSYGSFTVNGTYNIAVFAADNQSFMGIPLQTGVIQTGGTSGTNTVSGYVSTALAGHTDLSVINAAVSLSNTAYSTVTDSNGYFRLENVTPGPYSLVITASGMNPVTVPINVQTGANPVSNIPQMNVQGSCDVNGDGKIGLEEAIHALQVTAGIGK